MSGDARVRLLGGACGGTRRPVALPEFDLVLTFYVEGARDMADVQRLQREWLDRLVELVWAAMEGVDDGGAGVIGPGATSKVETDEEVAG